MAKKLENTPMQPIVPWYTTLIREARKQHGDDWIDKVPSELQKSLLIIHQAALIEWIANKQDKEKCNDNSHIDELPTHR